MPNKVKSILPNKVKSILPNKVKSILPNKVKSILPNKMSFNISVKGKRNQEKTYLSNLTFGNKSTKVLQNPTSININHAYTMSYQKQTMGNTLIKQWVPQK